MYWVGASKQEMLRTMEFFNVNRVIAMSPADFILYKCDPSKLWGIRTIDKRLGGGKFVHALNRKEIIEAIGTMKMLGKPYIICESMYGPDNHNLIYNGEVWYGKDSTSFYVYEWRGWLSYQKGLSVREAQHNAANTIIRSRFQVPDTIIDYVLTKKLVGYVIEFSLYDIPVGIYNENLLVWEIRKY